MDKGAERYRRDDYTAEEVIARLLSVVLCQNMVDDMKNNFSDFGHYWR
jgi:hypothetical protein